MKIMTKDQFEKVVAESDDFDDLAESLRQELFPLTVYGVRLAEDENKLEFYNQHDPDGYDFCTLEVRADGEYKDQGVFLPHPPTGFEYAIVQDRDEVYVLILRSKQ